MNNILTHDWKNAPFIGARGEIVKDGDHVFTNGEVQLMALRELREEVDYYLANPDKTPEFDEVRQFEDATQLSFFIKTKLPKIRYVSGYYVSWTVNAIRIHYEDREGDY